MNCRSEFAALEKVLGKDLAAIVGLFRGPRLLRFGGRIFTVTLGAAAIAAVLMATAVWSEEQTPKVPSQSSQSQAAPAQGLELKITSFRLLDVRPDPIVLGRSAVGQFIFEVEYADPSDVRSEISVIVDRLTVVVDMQKPLQAAASITSVNLPKLPPGKIVGSVAFRLDASYIGSTFLGLNWGESHLLHLFDPDTNLKSDFATVKIESPAALRWGIIVGATIFACLVAIGAWWTDFPGRFLRARRTMWVGTSASTEAAVVPSGGAKVGMPDEPRRPAPLPDVPGSLLGALSDGRAILVLGGGASARAGFPTGPALLYMLLQQLRDRLPKALSESLGAYESDAPDRLAYRGGTFSKVMSALTSKVSRKDVAGTLQEILGKVDPDPDFHEKLAGLPWRGVVSLTWDTFAESVFIESRPRNGEWQKFALDQATDLVAAVRGGRRLFVRPFGDLERPATLSLSFDEFRQNLLRWPEFGRQLGLLLQTQSFMFIGVGTDTLEEFLQSVGAELKIDEQRHFALVPDSPENGLLSATLSRFGVGLLPYAPDGDHQAVSDFVSSLAKRARSLAPSRRARTRPAGSELAISRIESVSLENIGLFDSLELKFQTTALPDTQSTPWTVIFGPNGCGKSTILRAIGLAFCGSEASAAAARLLQVGKKEGLVEVQFGSHLLRVRLIRDREVIVSSGQTSPVQAGFALVLGFPALRGAISDDPRGVAPLDVRNAEPADLLPMINGEVDRRLGRFKQWLVNILEQAGRGDRPAVALLALLNDIIRDVVPGEFRKFAPLDKTYLIRVKTDDSDEPSPDDLPFDDMSQGITSIFNWLGVLAQRLYDFYPDSDKPQDQHAIIMIDEIDAHLHPDWQRRIVELTKKFFPNVQVLATSHSPLLAGALRGKELCILERDPSTRKVAPIAISIDTYGMRSQHILTSPIFGLSSDRNPDLENRIKRHVELMQMLNPTPEQQKELEELTEELREFRYVGARPLRKIDSLSQDDIQILRKRFASTDDSVTSTTPREGPAP